MIAPSSSPQPPVDVRRRWMYWIAGIVLFLSPLGLWRSSYSQQAPVWHATGVDVGPAQRIALATDKGLTVFYRWSQMGLWRSVDGGRSWAQIGAGLPANFLGGQLLQALASGAGSTLYALAGAGDRYGLYRSTDSGATFELLYQPVAFIPTQMAVKPHADGDRILLTGDASVTASIDGGITWQTQTLPGPVRALFANQELWVAGSGWLGKSTDGGVAWQIIPLPTDITPRFLHSGGSAPERLYLGHDRGLLRSSDAGTTWQPLSLPQLRHTPLALAIDPIVWQTLYLGDDGGTIWRSDDDGRNWQILPGPNTGPIQTLFVTPDDRSRLYVAASADLWWRSQIALEPTPTATSTPSPTATPTSTPSPTATSTPTTTPTPSPTPIIVKLTPTLTSVPTLEVNPPPANDQTPTTTPTRA